MRESRIFSKAGRDCRKKSFLCLCGLDGDFKNFLKFLLHEKPKNGSLASIKTFLSHSGRWGNKQRDIENKKAGSLGVGCPPSFLQKTALLQRAFATDARNNLNPQQT
ncbi:MAG: hypothetical protein LUD39_04015 [Opitutae bacterium]|nr:hypothetical protein [Opitutae bacterium]